MQSQHHPLIRLPYYEDIEEGNYGYGKLEARFFYTDRQDPIIMVPPGIIQGHGMASKQLSKLTTKDELGNASITEAGKNWAREYWDLYPFIDREQVRRITLLVGFICTQPR